MLMLAACAGSLAGSPLEGAPLTSRRSLDAVPAAVRRSLYRRPRSYTALAAEVTSLY